MFVANEPFFDGVVLVLWIHEIHEIVRCFDPSFGPKGRPTEVGRFLARQNQFQ